MKKYRGIYFTAILFLMGSLMLTSCKKETPASKEEKTPEVSATIDPEQPTKDPAADNPDSNIEAVSPSPDAQKETSIPIYGMNEETLESEPANAKVKGEVTAESIVQAVVDSFSTHSIDIGIDQVIQEENRVIVSFKSDMAPIVAVGSDVEETILNCISDSLMDNLETCKFVVFRSEGKAYESGHLAFSLDEVYASE